MKYFLHDSNSFNDEKITELYLEFGYEGLGLFYTILEKLALQEKPIKTNVLKHQLNVGKKLERCWKFMEQIDLISTNNGETFNKQLLNFSEKYQIKKEKNAKRIAEWRENQSVSENVTDYKNVSNTHKVKESKVKQSKIKESNNEIVDFITFRDQLFATWFDYKKQKKSSYTEIGKATLIKQWEGKTDDQLQSAIEHSIANNYQGLFEPKNNNSLIAEKKGKIQTNLENINTAQQAIKHNMKDGKVINNPFDISKW